MESTAEKPPFHSIKFTIADQGGRRLFQMTSNADGTFSTQVQKGSASNPSLDESHTLPLESARELRDELGRIGVFEWEDSYDDKPGAPLLKWSLLIVFEVDVFSLDIRGGSAVPPHFDDLLQALYKLDFPRPVGEAPAAPSGNAAAVGTAGMDFSQLFGQGGMDPQMMAQMQTMMSQMQSNPEMIADQMRMGFHDLPIDQQNQLLDMLASTGTASREWWENFLRG